jgi:hypothetical protein
MPPRHAYWTILVDNQATAFRAHDAEELLPTLNRLKGTHSTAVMKWFERGRLWDSREAAREAGLGRGERRWEGPRPDKMDEREPSSRQPGQPSARGPDAPRDRRWRPGGDHRDPRQKYADAKKAKWKRFKDGVRARAEEKRGKPDGPPQRAQTQRSREDHRWRRDQDRRGDWRPKGPQTERAGRWQSDERPEWRQRAPADQGRRDDRKRPPFNRGGSDRPWSNRPPYPRDERATGGRRWTKPEGGRPSSDRPGFQPRGSGFRRTDDRPSQGFKNSPGPHSKPKWRKPDGGRPPFDRRDFKPQGPGFRRDDRARGPHGPRRPKKPEGEE